MATRTKEEPKQKRRNIMMSDPLWEYALKLAAKEEISISALLRRGVKVLAQLEKKKAAR